MSSSKELNKLIRNSLLILIIMGCSGVSAQSESTTVTIMVGEQGPDGCELLGKVKGSSKEDQTSEANEDNTSYVDRLIKARNNLRNETQKLGGNNVHIIYFNNTGKYEIPGIDKEIIFVGNVYRCK